MPQEQCLARLVVAATHDLRNALAVMRECTGLAEDLLRFNPPSSQGQEEKQKAADRIQRARGALAQVQAQIRRGAALSEGMGYLASSTEDEALSARCDINKVVEDFCVLMARQAKSCALRLQACPAKDPMPAPLSAVQVFGHLLTVFDACASVGGGVGLTLSPILMQGNCAIAVDLEPSANGPMVLSALSSCPLLQPAPKSWCAKWLPLGTNTPRFLVLLKNTTQDDKEHDSITA